MDTANGRYFISNIDHVLDFHQKIKGKKVQGVVQVIVQGTIPVRKLTWFLLKENISFQKTSQGAGIYIFYIDTKVKFFVEKK
jgi:hypothetical protein